MVIFGVPVAGLTAPVLLGIGILLILTGRLVPRRTYDDALRDRDRWQQAHSVSEEARLTQTKQLDAVLEVGETVKQVMLALDRVRREDRRE
jgi:hypothetical protein